MLIKNALKYAKARLAEAEAINDSLSAEYWKQQIKIREEEFKTSERQRVIEAWEDIKQMFQEVLPYWHRDKLEWVKDKVCSRLEKLVKEFRNAKEE